MTTKTEGSFTPAHRDLTPAELRCWYEEGKWPCCGGTKYLPGPSGCAAMNIKCPDCGTMMNVMNPAEPYTFPWGQMLEEPPNYRPPVYMDGKGSKAWYDMSPIKVRKPTAIERELTLMCCLGVLTAFAWKYEHVERPMFAIYMCFIGCGLIPLIYAWITMLFFEQTKRQHGR